MAVKHTILPRWATNDVIDPTTLLNNVIEPAEAKKDIGWNYIEKPARQYFNWLGRQTNQWLDYLNDSVNMFAPYETDPATMAISLNAGRINLGTDVLNVAAQDTGTMTAPITNPRIDRIVIDETSGVASIIAGSEAASPTAPAFNQNQVPIAQILLYVGMTEIVNDDITDERSAAPFNDLLASDLYLIKPDSTGIGAYFQNSTTGSTAADGFFVGIDQFELARVWNYEATEVWFGNNGTMAGKIGNGNKWLISPDGTNMAPLHELVVYNSLAASDSFAQFLNDGTGIGATDGFIIGIDTTERALVWNQENTELRFGTANILRGKIDEAGRWLTTITGSDITPTYELTVYDNGAGSSSYIQFLNDGTGVTSGDGLLIGINTTEQVLIWNQENTEMRFGTNSVLRGKITASGNWLISPGGLDVTPGRDLSIYSSVASGSAFSQFCNSTTGIAAGDGFIVGISSGEEASLWNYENTVMLFATNNLERMRIEADGSVEIGTGLTNQGVGTLNVLNGIYVNNILSEGTFVTSNNDLPFGTNNTFRGKIDNGGNWLISPVGTDIATPAFELVIYDSAGGGAAYAQFINDGTGTTATDGFLIGIDTTERATLWNYESTDMRFGTANIFRGKIDNGGNWLISPGGVDVEPTHQIVIYNASGGALSQFVSSATGAASGDGVLIGLSSANTLDLWNQENTRMRFATNNLERMTIEADGSVEIGTGLTNQGIGTLNVLNGIYINNVALSIPVEYTATGSLALAATSSGNFDISHGLGTDDVIVHLTARGLSSAFHWQIVATAFGAYSTSFRGDFRTAPATLLASSPAATGQVRLAVYNLDVSANTIAWRIIIRKRV